MASNLSCIGFHFADDDAFRAAIERLAMTAGERLVTPAGEYAIWRSRSGAELWFHLAAAAPGSDEREIIGFTPFFEGKSEIPVKLTTRMQRPEDNAFEGAWTAWVAPDETGEGSYPVLFDVVDAAATADVAAPRPALVRLTGFARQLRGFATEAEHHASSATSAAPQLAVQSFVPLGLFADAASDAGSAASPSSTALLTGRVLEHARLVNEETGRHFDWLLLDSLDATYDIVADPDVVSGTIVVGGTAEAACWMVGRMLDET